MISRLFVFSVKIYIREQVQEHRRWNHKHKADMYICMHVCMHVCVVRRLISAEDLYLRASTDYAHIHAYIHALMHVCFVKTMHICAYIHTYMHTYVHMSAL